MNLHAAIPVLRVMNFHHVLLRLVTGQLLLSLSTNVFPSALTVPETVTAFADTFSAFGGLLLHCA
jgi:hypothetical protein